MEQFTSGNAGRDPATEMARFASALAKLRSEGVSDAEIVAGLKTNPRYAERVAAAERRGEAPETTLAYFSGNFAEYGRLANRGENDPSVGGGTLRIPLGIGGTALIPIPEWAQRAAAGAGARIHEISRAPEQFATWAFGSPEQKAALAAENRAIAALNAPLLSTVAGRAGEVAADIATGLGAGTLIGAATRAPVIAARGGQVIRNLTRGNVSAGEAIAGAARPMAPQSGLVRALMEQAAAGGALGASTPIMSDDLDMARNLITGAGLGAAGEAGGRTIGRALAPFAPERFGPAANRERVERVAQGLGLEPTDLPGSMWLPESKLLAATERGARTSAKDTGTQILDKRLREAYTRQLTREVMPGAAEAPLVSQADLLTLRSAVKAGEDALRADLVQRGGVAVTPGLRSQMAALASSSGAASPFDARLTNIVNDVVSRRALGLDDIQLLRSQLSDLADEASRASGVGSNDLARRVGVLRSLLKEADPDVSQFLDRAGKLTAIERAARAGEDTLRPAAVLRERQNFLGAGTAAARRDEQAALARNLMELADPSIFAPPRPTLPGLNAIASSGLGGGLGLAAAMLSGNPESAMTAALGGAALGAVSPRSLIGAVNAESPLLRKYARGQLIPFLGVEAASRVPRGAGLTLASDDSANDEFIRRYGDIVRRQMEAVR
jgi:hypothetical protein